MTKTLNQHTVEEITLIKTTTTNSASYGFGVSKSAALVGLSTRQLQTLLEEDSEFRSEYEKARTESIKEVSAKMHESCFFRLKSAHFFA